MDKEIEIEHLKIEMFLKYRNVILEFYQNRKFEKNNIYDNYKYSSSFIQRLMELISYSSPELKKIINKYIGDIYKIYSRSDCISALKNVEMINEIRNYQISLVEKSKGI